MAFLVGSLLGLFQREAKWNHSLWGSPSCHVGTLEVDLKGRQWTPFFEVQISVLTHTPILVALHDFTGFLEGYILAN